MVYCDIASLHSMDLSSHPWPLNHFHFTWSCIIPLRILAPSLFHLSLLFPCLQVRFFWSHFWEPISMFVTYLDYFILCKRKQQKRFSKYSKKGGETSILCLFHHQISSIFMAIVLVSLYQRIHTESPISTLVILAYIIFPSPIISLIILTHEFPHPLILTLSTSFPIPLLQKSSSCLFYN